MRKLLIGFAGLVILLVAAALIAPSFIDWNGYKGRITAAIEDATGLSLAIDGNIALAILPSPTLAVSGLRVVGAGESDLVRLGELRVRVGVAGLLERRIDVTSVTLIKPLISLQVDADGTQNWNLTPLSGAFGSEGEAAAEVPSTSAPEFDISLTNLLIEDGSLHYRDAASGVDERVEQVDATMSAASLEGPFKVAANATLRGQRLDIALATGRIQTGRPIALELSVETAEPRTALEYAGTLSDLTDAGRLEGKLRVNGTNADLLIAKHMAMAPLPQLSGDYSLAASISAARDGITLNDASIQLGESRATGAIDARFGDPLHASFAVNFTNLDLDALLAQVAAIAPSESVSSAAAGSSGGTGGQDSVSQTQVEPSFELPADMNVSLDLEAGVVHFRSGIIREATVRAILSNGSIAVEQATALLPGASDVSLSGFVQPVEGRPQFDGELAVNSDNLRGIFDWLEIAPASLPADRLRNFSFRSMLKATPEALEVTDINVELDASKITGGLAVALRDRPAFGLRVAVDKLNLDPYLQRPTAGGNQTKTSSSSVKQQPSAAAGSASKTSAELGPLAFLNGFDANIDARVERLSVRDMVVEKLHVDTTLVGGKLTLHEASVGRIAGVAARISGDINGIAEKPSAALTFAASSGDVEALGRLAGVNLRLPRGAKRSVAVKGQLNGSLSDAAVKAAFDVLGTKASLEGRVKNVVIDPAYNFDVLIDHPDLADVMQLVAPDYRPAAANLGPLAISFRAAGTRTSANLTDVKGNAGPFALRGNANIRVDGARPDIKADIATSEILLDLILPIGNPPRSRSATRKSTAATTSASATKTTTGASTSASPATSLFPNANVELNGHLAALTMGPIRLEDPQFHLLLKDGRLNIDRFTAKAFGGSLESTAIVDGNHVEPRIASNVIAKDVQLQLLTNTFVEFDRAEGPISTNLEFAALGLTQQRVIATMNGKGSVTGKIRVLASEEEQAAAAAGSLIGALLGSKVREIRPLTNVLGVLVEAFGNRFAALTGDYTIANGVVRTEAAVLDGGSARAVTRGSANIPAWRINTVTAVYKGEGPDPIVTATLSGPLDAPNVKFGGRVLKPSGTTTQANPLEKLLPGILGGAKPQSPQKPQSGQPAKQLKPEDLLKDLLKGLGGG